MLLKAAVLPPGIVLIPAIIGLILTLLRRRSGTPVLAVAILLLWMLSTPWFAAAIGHELEWRYKPAKLVDVTTSNAQAIVGLGGGAYQKAREFNGYDEVSTLTLERRRSAARLHRITK